jgi:hypothetical protein
MREKVDLVKEYDHGKIHDLKHLFQGKLFVVFTYLVLAIALLPSLCDAIVNIIAGYSSGEVLYSYIYDAIITGFIGVFYACLFISLKKKCQADDNLGVLKIISRIRILTLIYLILKVISYYIGLQFINNIDEINEILNSLDVGIFTDAEIATYKLYKNAYRFGLLQYIALLVVLIVSYRSYLLGMTNKAKNNKFVALMVAFCIILVVALCAIVGAILASCNIVNPFSLLDFTSLFNIVSVFNILLVLLEGSVLGMACYFIFQIRKILQKEKNTISDEDVLYYTINL